MPETMPCARWSQITACASGTQTRPPCRWACSSPAAWATWTSSAPSVSQPLLCSRSQLSQGPLASQEHRISGHGVYSWPPAGHGATMTSTLSSVMLLHVLEEIARLGLLSCACLHSCQAEACAEGAHMMAHVAMQACCRRSRRMGRRQPWRQRSWRSRPLHSASRWGTQAGGQKRLAGGLVGSVILKHLCLPVCRDGPVGEAGCLLSLHSGSNSFCRCMRAAVRLHCSGLGCNQSPACQAQMGGMALLLQASSDRLVRAGPAAATSRRGSMVALWPPRVGHLPRGL